MRDMVFLSHANPEDNEFTRWLALRLAREGYAVWCDLTKLLGGEAWWDDIEDAIRNRTAKFLYVLSRISNNKDGARKELAIAHSVQRSLGLKNFVIPAWIDGLTPAEFNVELHRLNAIPFQSSWASGLAQLLQKLAEDNVPKKSSFNSRGVGQWWRDHIAGTRIVQTIPESLATNWYPLESSTIYFHELTREDTGSLTLPDKLSYPGVKHEQFLVSFAPADDFAGQLGALRIASSQERLINAAEGDSRPRLWSFRDERRHLTDLLRQVWNRLLADRALAAYEFANGARGFYYREKQIANDTIWFPRLGGDGKGRRQIVGYSTIKGRDGYPKGRRVWHFALEAKPTSYPLIGYTMRSHVLFSDDGTTIWTSKDRLHRARRSQCKNWWNDDWRDRISAMLHSISDAEGVIALRVGVATMLRLQSTPIILESPVSYDEDVAVQAHIEFEDEQDEVTEEVPALRVAEPSSNEYVVKRSE